MSTKTTFKRIALVAVAALGFGTLSVAPSSAATVFAADNVTVVTASSSTTVGVAATSLVKLEGICLGAYTHYDNANTPNDGGYGIQNNIGAWGLVLQSVPSGLTTYTAGTLTVRATDTTYPYVGVPTMIQAGGSDPSAVALQCSASGGQTGYATASFTPTKAGTYTFKIKGVFQAYAEASWTVVATDPVVKSSTAFLNTTIGSASTVDATAADLTFASTASTTAKARLDVKQYSTTDTATPATTAISQVVVVAIDKGLVSKTNDYSAGAASVIEAAAGSTDGASDYYVFANGTVGSASLTVTVGGVLVATKAIVFSGLATTLSAALTTGQKTWIAPTQTTTLTVSAKDSAGNAASNTPTITATSADVAVATVVATSNTLVTITGVAVGTSVITIADAATTSPAASTTYTVTVKPATTTAAATMTFDKTDYAPGELMTITIAADIADNATYAAFTANPVVSVSVVTVLSPFTSGAVALVGGKATWTAYAPATGNVTVTATSSAGPTTAVAVTATANVVNDALDAASEALDAANAATDAANAAAEAADAATAAAQDAADAVAALATQVATYISNLRKQITALTNIVIKIQKKVKA